MEKKYTEAELKNNSYHSWNDMIYVNKIHDIVDRYLVFFDRYRSYISFTYNIIECVPLTLFRVGSTFSAVPVELKIRGNALLRGHSYYVDNDYVGSVLITRTETDAGWVENVKWVGA